MLKESIYRRLPLALVCLLLAVPPLVAQQIPKIEFEKYTLPNGLQVILHRDSKLPMVHVNLWYHVGAKNEAPGRTGFAHLFEHMMFQGTKHAGDEPIVLLERAGANLLAGGVNGTTNFDRTNYFETLPRESLELALWFESDRMGFLLDAFTEEKLNNQRDVVKNERRQGVENVPYGRITEIIWQELFPKGHPYSHSVIGSMEDLTAASPEDVKEFFRTYYTPNNCTLTIAGDFDPAEAKRLVEKYFGPLPPGPALARAKRWVMDLAEEKRLVVWDRVPQDRLYLIWPSLPYFEPGDAELDIVARLLTDGKDSRLYKALVYEKQIASAVSATNASLEAAGLFSIVATARPGHSLEELEEAIDTELARLAQYGPTPDELTRALAKEEYSFLTDLERIGGFGGKADRLAMYNTYLGDPDFFQQDFDRYQKLTRTDIQKAAEGFLNHRRRLVVSFLREQSQRPTVAEFDRSQQPAIGARRAFTPLTPQSQELANGLTLVVAERHEVPKVAVSLVVGSGAAADPGEQAGLAWMTARMLDEGTKTRSALQIASELGRLGTQLSTYADTASSQVRMQAIKRHLPASLDLLADIVLNPTFPADELERQRRLRLDAILQERTNPSAIARRLFPQLLFGADHPYGHPAAGVEASVKHLTHEALVNFHAAHWRPNNATLIFVGDITLAEAVVLAERYFGGWERKAVPAVRVAAVKPAGITVYLVDRQGAAQSQVWVGGLGPARQTPDYYPLEVVNSILGGSFTSRLILNLREAKGYSYGVYSNFNYQHVQGAWVSFGGVQTAVTKEALTEYIKEVSGIGGQKPISAVELDQAKSNLARGYAQRFESLAQVSNELAALVALGQALTHLSEYVAGVEAVSLAEAQRAASGHLVPAQLVIVVVGDLKKIEAGVRELNLGKVVIVDADGNPVSTSSGN